MNAPGRQTGRQIANAGRRAADNAEDSGQEAVQSKPFRMLLTVGLIAYGVVHILIGWIALQIAWSGLRSGTGGSSGGAEASQQGALDEMAAPPLGAVLLWITAVGLFALAIWQVVEAIWGHRDRPAGFKRIRKQIGSGGRAVAYAAIGVAAVRNLLGNGGSSNGTEEGWTARLMAAPLGRILVGVLAVAVIALGVRLVLRGVKKKFTDDLAGGVGRGVVRLGQIGYTVKGVAFAIVGGLFGWAAITYDPEKAGGLDDALRTVNGAPFGAGLLTLMALGLACFGVYCFAWARHPKVSTDSDTGHQT